VPLEKFFDHNDVAKDPKLVPNYDDVEEVNIETVTQLKIIKLSRALLPAARHKYIDLMKEYADIFAWRYSDLKAYDTNFIQQTIPIREDEKPFK